MELSLRLMCQLGALVASLFIPAILAQPTGGGGWDIGDVIGLGNQEEDFWGRSPAWLYPVPAASPASPSDSHGGKGKEPASPTSQGSGAQGENFEDSRQPPAWVVPSADATEQQSSILHAHSAGLIPPAAPILASEGDMGSTSLASVSASAHPPEARHAEYSGDEGQERLLRAWLGQDFESQLWTSRERFRKASAPFEGSLKEWETWLAHMRRATGRPSLMVSPVNLLEFTQDQVFVAKDLDSVVYPHPSQAQTGGRWTGGLLNRPPPGWTEHDIERVKAIDRIYVYFNSKNNMDFINREYFLGRAHPLPILEEHLTRNNLNKIFAARNSHVLFPPRTEHGLPLLVVRHTGGERTSMYIRSITGVDQKMYLMSLWSPVLFDGKRYTSILYGVMGFDSLYTYPVMRHLEAMSQARDPSTYASLYALEEAAHRFH